MVATRAGVVVTVCVHFFMQGGCILVFGTKRTMVGGFLLRKPFLKLILTSLFFVSYKKR